MGRVLDSSFLKFTLVLLLMLLSEIHINTHTKNVYIYITIGTSMYYILFLETEKKSNFSHYVKMVSSVKTVHTRKKHGTFSQS